MDKIQQFFQNFYAMTFEGKSAFWIGCAAILVIALVYMFSSKVRDKMKKASWLLLIIPVLAVCCAVYAVIGANAYVPLARRTAETAAYDWESTTQSSKAKIEYTTDVKAPKTGEVFVQKYKFKELKNDLQRDGSNGYASETVTLTSDDESTEITFSPDGTYIFKALESGAEESGEYIFRNKVLTLSNASGNDAFSKNIREWFANNLGGVIAACVGLAALILAFVFNTQIKLFLKKHPLVWLIIPAALLIYFVYVAIGWNIWVSVSDWPDGSLTASYGFGGFGQYQKMFGDESFWSAVWNTLKLFAIIPICLLLGMGMAIVMDQGLRGTPVFRTLILLPFALSFVVTGLIWQQMYNGNGGILMEFLKLFGVNSTVNWTSNEMVMYSIIIVMIWQFSGYVAVIFLAAIKNVSTSMGLLPAHAEGIAAQVYLEARVKDIIEVDGLQFKDLNDNGELDPYEDWRLTAEERAENLLSMMDASQKAAQMVHLTLVSKKDSWFSKDNVGFALVYEYIFEMEEPDEEDEDEEEDEEEEEALAITSHAMNAAVITNEIQELSESSELGIPVIFSMDTEAARLSSRTPLSCPMKSTWARPTTRPSPKSTMKCSRKSLWPWACAWRSLPTPI